MPIYPSKCMVYLNIHVDHRAPLSIAFCRQEYWSELPFATPGDLPNLLWLLHWQAGSLPAAPRVKPHM